MYRLRAYKAIFVRPQGLLQVAVIAFCKASAYAAANQYAQAQAWSLDELTVHEMVTVIDDDVAEELGNRNEQ